jgi:ribosome-associated protein
MSSGLLNELRFQFIPSSGPGGQNVNKVATAVILQYDALHSKFLSDSQRDRLFKIAGKKLNQEGVLTILARKYRSQELNRKDAIRRFNELIKKAKKTDKNRHATKPTSSSVEHRLESKKTHSNLKKMRSKKSLLMKEL